MRLQDKSSANIRFVSIGSVLLAAGLIGAGCNGGEEIIQGPNGGAGGTTPMTSAGTPSTSGTGNVPTTAGTGGAGTTGGVGTAGTPTTAGTGGAGGAPTTAGTGGMDMGGSGGSGGAPENLADAVKGWDGWRFEMPCKSFPGGQPLDDSCSMSDICWVGTDATAPYKEEKAITMAGDPTKVYEFELWARGVIEPKVHTGCERITAPKEGAGGIAICKGGGDSNSGFNLWSITIEDPPQLYWMNDADNDTHRTNVLDGKFKVQARGGTKVTFKFDNKNTGQINNGCPSLRKVIEGVEPYPKYYVGNFFQLNVTAGSVKLVP